MIELHLLNDILVASVDEGGGELKVWPRIVASWDDEFEIFRRGIVVVKSDDSTFFLCKMIHDTRKGSFCLGTRGGEAFFQFPKRSVLFGSFICVFQSKS